MTSHQDVADYWKRGQDRTGCNMFCEDDTIYSYGRHFPIAKRRIGFTLFNKNDYSVSTSKHKGIVRGVIYGDVIELINCDESMAEATFDSNINEIKDLMAKHKRARTRKADIQAEIEYLFEQNELLKENYLKEKIVESL